MGSDMESIFLFDDKWRYVRSLCRRFDADGAVCQNNKRKSSNCCFAIKTLFDKELFLLAFSIGIL